jgi:hypothetical protein
MKPSNLVRHPRNGGFRGCMQGFVRWMIEGKRGKETAMSSNEMTRLWQQVIALHQAVYELIEVQRSIVEMEVMSRSPDWEPFLTRLDALRQRVEDQREDATSVLDEDLAAADSQED